MRQRLFHTNFRKSGATSGRWLRPWNTWRPLPAVLMLLGAILLVYVGSQYAEMYEGQQSLERQWMAQQEHHLEQRGPSLEAIAENGLTRISIPKIDLSAIVVEGTDYRALKLGPGHMTGTSVPGGQGNVVISAHRDTFFRHIAELREGDQVLLQRNGRSYTYVVTGHKIVEPDDVEVAGPTNDNRLTLITCYPTYYIGPAPQRLVVTAELQGEPDTRVARDVRVNAKMAKSLPGDN